MSQAQINANRQNAQLSTGPTSVAGKAVSSRNAGKHGIYAEALIFPGENPEDLAALQQAYQDQFQPQGPVEEKLVEILVRSDWMGKRYDRIEPYVVRISADPSKSPEEALAELFSRTRNNPLAQLERRRQAAQRDWFRALKELQRLQKERHQAAETAAAPASAGTPAPAPEIGFVPATGPVPSQTPAEPPAAAPDPLSEGRNPVIK